MDSISKSIPLYGVDSLCFDKEEFMKDTFNVDTFVQINQASGCGGLETLRDDLGVYLKILRSAMIDLINRDYADFVNLSTNLTGLDRLIEALKTPLGQLKEEVMSVEHMLKDAIETISSDLNRRHSIYHQKALLHRLSQISIRLDRLESLLKSKKESTSSKEMDEESNTDELVDRIAAEINHLNFLVSQCEGAALLSTFKPRVDAISTFVEVGLERGLREGIQGENKDLLLRTLRNYASLGAINHAHQHVQQIIRNHLEEIINDQAFKSDPRGLHGIYEKTLTAVRKICDPLLRITQESSFEVLSGYSFLESSAFPEIVNLMETRTPHIFNPGNPTAFHERCKESISFLNSFESLLIYDYRIEAFRNLPDYTRFHELWNLPVYFQIRYQEIGQVLESSLNENDDFSCIPPPDDKSPFMLKTTHMTWHSLVKCWDPDIFLPPLIHRFWKLTLLILSRYRTWLSDTTATLKTKRKYDVGSLKTISSTSDLSSIPKHDPMTSPKSFQDLSSLSKEGSSDMDEDALVFCIALIHDIDTFAVMLGVDFYTNVINPWIEHLALDKQIIIKDMLELQVGKHKLPQESLLEALVDSLTSSAILPLKQVTDTPRLYRRTNKPLPTSSQPYVANSLSLIKKFSLESQGKMKSQVANDVTIKACTSVIEQYHKLVYDVLNSVYKMEESLKRLKRARERGTHSGADATGIPTDDDKIRTQIHLDVVSLGEQINSFGVDTKSLKCLSALLSMTTQAKEGKFIP